MGKRQVGLGSIVIFLGLFFSSCNSSSLTVDCDVGKLIQAINSANYNPNPSTLILADSCQYILTAFDNQVDLFGNPDGSSGNTGLPVITTPITIIGKHTTITRLNSAPEMRFFLVETTGDLTLQDLTLDGGVVESGLNGYRVGGAIVNRGTLNIVNSEVINNYTEDAGGAIYNKMAGTLNISNSSISDNESRLDAGAILNLGTLMIELNSIINGNSTHGEGGAIRNNGILTISMSQVSFNYTLGLGGAVYASPGSSMTLDQATLSNNRSNYDGGAIFVDNAVFEISECIFHDNEASHSGGGVFVVDSTGTIGEDTTFSSNHADVSGGGVYISVNSDVLIDMTTFMGNVSYVEGGGLANSSQMTNILVNHSTFEANSSFHGGGIANDGRMTVRNSTLNQNSGQEGGGVDNSGLSLSLINSTISGNEGLVEGGGLKNEGSMSILFSTIAFNHSPQGGGISDVGDLLRIKNSIVSNNTNSNCEVLGTLTVIGDNLNDDGSCSGFTLHTNPFLGALAEVGGPTQTHPFLFSSPAMDSALDCTNFSGNTAISSDQRSEPRPYGAECDLGAYEAQALLHIFNVIVQVHVELLNCNEGPNPMFMVIQSFSFGDNLTALGRNADGSWLGIAGMNGQADEVVCWVPSDGVDTPEPVMGFPHLMEPEHPPDPCCEAEAFDRCALFASETYSLTLMDIPYGTGDLRLYVYMPEGVPGLELEVPEDTQPWEYLGILGDYESEACSFEGYAGRLYCRHEIPERYLGTVRAFSLMVNGCLDPVFTHEWVTIPEPVEPPVCSAALEETACNDAGGTYSCTASSVCECSCP